MPVTLPPISRRRFLQTTMAAGAGALLPLPAWGQASPGNPHRLALLSDTHIDQNPVTTGGSPAVNMTDNLRQCLGQVMAGEHKPDRVLVCGDCAYLTGEEADYAQFVTLVGPLQEAGVPLHCVLGNHDHFEHFVAAGIAQAPNDPPVEHKHVGVVEMERANWFLLDSLKQTNITPGRLGADQIEWLAQALDAHADKPGLVMLHHTFRFVDEADVGGALEDWAPLFEVIGLRKQVKAVFFGHSHNWHTSTRDGIHLVNLPPTAYVFAQDRPNGWVACDLLQGGLELTLNTLDPVHEQNGQVIELAYRDA